MQEVGGGGDHGGGKEARKTCRESSETVLGARLPIPNEWSEAMIKFPSIF